MKNLTQKEYSPQTKPFNFQEVIKKQVEKESWSIVELPEVELPTYEKVEMKWTNVSKVAFGSLISYFSI